jgi:hypothetical protein
MVLMCKTISVHPEYAVRENKAIRRSLAGLASTCLEKLETYASARCETFSISRSLEKESLSELALSPSLANPGPTSNPTIPQKDTEYKATPYSCPSRLPKAHCFI